MNAANYISTAILMMNQDSSYTDAIQLGIKHAGNICELDLDNLDPSSDYHEMITELLAQAADDIGMTSEQFKLFYNKLTGYTL